MSKTNQVGEPSLPLVAAQLYLGGARPLSGHRTRGVFAVPTGKPLLRACRALITGRHPSRGDA